MSKIAKSDHAEPVQAQKRRSDDAGPDMRLVLGAQDSDKPDLGKPDFSKPDLGKTGLGKGGPRPPGRVRRALRFLAKLLLPLAVLAGGALSYTWLKATRPVPEPRAEQERVYAIRSVPVRLVDVRPTLRLYGQTLAGRQVALRALVSGEVVAIGPNLRNGAIVAKGETVLKIDPFDYEGALTEAEARLTEARARLDEIEAQAALEEVNLERAREQLALAEKDVERVRALAGRGTVSRKLFDDRRVVASQRRQAVEQRQGNFRVQVARASQQRAAITRLAWAMRRAKRRLEDTVLKAPFTAYITDVGGEVGRMLGVNDRVATLLDRNWIEAKFTLSDSQYGRILAADGTLDGRRVEVAWRVGDGSKLYPAHIVRVAPRVSAASGGVDVYAKLDNPLTPLPIRAGTFVELGVPDRAYAGVVRLPQTALYNGDTVFAIEKGRLAARKVRVVGTAGNDILVTDHLEPGERVMRTRLSAPGPGLKVREVGETGAGETGAGETGAGETGAGKTAAGKGKHGA